MPGQVAPVYRILLQLVMPAAERDPARAMPQPRIAAAAVVAMQAVVVAAMQVVAVVVIRAAVTNNLR